jgi:hypothetical protein
VTNKLARVLSEKSIFDPTQKKLSKKLSRSGLTLVGGQKGEVEGRKPGKGEEARKGSPTGTLSGSSAVGSPKDAAANEAAAVARDALTFPPEEATASRRLSQPGQPGPSQPSGSESDDLRRVSSSSSSSSSELASSTAQEDHPFMPRRSHAEEHTFAEEVLHKIADFFILKPLELLDSHTSIPANFRENLDKIFGGGKHRHGKVHRLAHKLRKLLSLQTVEDCLTPKAIDTLYLTMFSQKVLLLILFTMPTDYGFGLKRRLLHWASRSLIVKFYVKIIGPANAVSVILFSLAAVRWVNYRRSRRAEGKKASISREILRLQIQLSRKDTMSQKIWYFLKSVVHSLMHGRGLGKAASAEGSKANSKTNSKPNSPTDGAYGGAGGATSGSTMLSNSNKIQTPLGRLSGKFGTGLDGNSGLRSGLRHGMSGSYTNLGALADGADGNVNAGNLSATNVSGMNVTSGMRKIDSLDSISSLLTQEAGDAEGIHNLEPQNIFGEENYVNVRNTNTNSVSHHYDDNHHFDGNHFAEPGGGFGAQGSFPIQRNSNTNRDSRIGPPNSSSNTQFNQLSSLRHSASNSSLTLRGSTSSQSLHNMGRDTVGAQGSRPLGQVRSDSINNLKRYGSGMLSQEQHHPANGSGQHHHPHSGARGSPLSTSGDPHQHSDQKDHHQHHQSQVLAISSKKQQLIQTQTAEFDLPRLKWLGALNTLLMYCISRLYELIRGDARPLLEVEKRAAERDLLAFQPPPMRLVRKIEFNIYD